MYCRGAGRLAGSIDRYMGRAVPRGFTLMEFLLAVAIIGVLAAVAWPSYARYIERSKVARAQMEIVSISGMIKAFYLDHRDWPDTLAQIGANNVDPWGEPYAYQPFRTDADLKKARKNRNLHPINSDFDLYSMGKDRKSKAPLVAKESRDDVVRANDGAFVGLAETYSQ
jgi:general secretion pathway protein G